jgi:Fe2+ transport system protein B
VVTAAGGEQPRKIERKLTMNTELKEAKANHQKALTALQEFESERTSVDEERRQAQLKGDTKLARKLASESVALYELIETQTTLVADSQEAVKQLEQKQRVEDETEKLKTSGHFADQLELQIQEIKGEVNTYLLTKAREIFEWRKVQNLQKTKFYSALLNLGISHTTEPHKLEQFFEENGVAKSAARYPHQNSYLFWEIPSPASTLELNYPIEQAVTAASRLPVSTEKEEEVK